MAITVKSYLTMRQAVGNRVVFEIDFDEITIQELLVELASTLGAD
jgi:hypothetical protein